MSQQGRILLETERFSVQTVTWRNRSGRTFQREVVRHPGAVTIVPILDDGRVCLIRNYRVSVAQTLIELPAGTLEPGEPPEETARRELMEETGFRAERMTPLQSFFMSPGILDERMHMYLAQSLKSAEPMREETEQIENLIVSWDRALEMVQNGLIQDAKSLVGLLLYARIRNSAH